MNAVSVDLWITGDNFDIIRIGTSGEIEDPQHKYDRISLSFRSPVTEAFITGSTLITTARTLLNDYPEFEVDRDFWQDVLATNGDGDLVQVPFFASGLVAGAFSFLTRTKKLWNTHDFATFDAIGAALALWATHPHNGAVNSTRKRPNNGGLGLSERQIEILLLVREGKSNAAISARLGYSISTIKQELQRIMSRLNALDRNHAVSVATELQLLPGPTAPPALIYSPHSE